MRTFILNTAVLLLLSCGQASEVATNVDGNLADSGTEDSRPKEPCAAIEGLLATAEDCVDLTALQKDVKPGPAALDAPAAMVRGKSYEVTLVIDRRKPEPPPLPPPPPPPDQADSNAMDTAENTADTVENESEVIEPATGSRGDVEDSPTANDVVAELPGADTPFPAQVGRFMTATLIGSGFDIKLISPGDPMQVIPRGGQGRWEWEVVPKMGGRRLLTVKTQAVGIVDGKPVPLGNGASVQAVEVKVSWPDRIWDALVAAPGWIKAVTAILVALGALLVAWKPIREWWRSRS